MKFKNIYVHVLLTSLVITVYDRLSLSYNFEKRSSEFQAMTQLINNVNLT
jgi:hypothetical protein